MKWVVLCSPVSGTGKGKETVEAELCPALEAKGVEYEVIYTEYKAHAVDLAKECSQWGVGVGVWGVRFQR